MTISQNSRKHRTSLPEKPDLSSKAVGIAPPPILEFLSGKLALEMSWNQDVPLSSSYMIIFFTSAGHVLLQFDVLNGDQFSERPFTLIDPVVAELPFERVDHHLCPYRHFVTLCSV